MKCLEFRFSPTIRVARGFQKSNRLPSTGSIFVVIGGIAEDGSVRDIFFLKVGEYYGIFLGLVKGTSSSVSSSSQEEEVLHDILNKFLVCFIAPTSTLLGRVGRGRTIRNYGLKEWRREESQSSGGNPSIVWVQVAWASGTQQMGKSGAEKKIKIIFSFVLYVFVFFKYVFVMYSFFKHRHFA